MSSSATMHLTDAVVRAHTVLTGGYRRMDLHAPVVAAAARPGQFVHLRIPGLEVSALRRPFSLYRAESETVSLLFKAVGRGTRSMTRIEPGAGVNLLGPLGNGFPLPVPPQRLPVLVAGGYGVAPLYFLASRMHVPGILMVGGRSAQDILCTAEFEALGWRVQVATEDGSRGTRGRVTVLLDAWLAAQDAGAAGPSVPAPEFFACGPDGLLRAVAERAGRLERRAWLSLDKHMGCAVGVCLACVQRLRRPDGTIMLGRVCRDGPVFEAGEIVWDGENHDA